MKTVAISPVFSMSLEEALAHVSFYAKEHPCSPVDPALVAKTLGLDLHYSAIQTGVCWVHYQRSETDAPSQIECSYCLELPQRFAIAKALGHHLLGHASTSFMIRGASFWVDPDEQAKEAHRFAVSFLIPEEMLRKKMKCINSEEELASVFHVPTSVMHQRIAWMNQPARSSTPRV